MWRCRLAQLLDLLDDLDDLLDVFFVARDDDRVQIIDHFDGDFALEVAEGVSKNAVRNTGLLVRKRVVTRHAACIPSLLLIGDPRRFAVDGMPCDRLGAASRSNSLDFRGQLVGDFARVLRTGLDPSFDIRLVGAINQPKQLHRRGRVPVAAIDQQFVFCPVDRDHEFDSARRRGTFWILRIGRFELRCDDRKSRQPVSSRIH